MLRILLADDEAFIRNGLKEMIRQLGEDYVVVGEAANGAEALELAALHRPDLVITDIKMPAMSGSELVAELARAHPDVEKLVLSGYDDYELVRDNFKNGVYDYLVKPIDKLHLTALLRQIEERIGQRRAQSDERVHERIRLNESFPLLKEQFLAKLAAGAYGEAACAEKLTYYRIDLGAPPYRALAVRVANYRTLVRSLGEDNARIHLFIVRNIIEDTLSEAGVKHESFAKDGTVFALLGALPPEAAAWKALLRRTEANLRGFAKVPVHLAAGSDAGAAAALKDSCAAAERALSHAFYKDDTSLIGEQDARRSFAEPPLGDWVDASAFALHDAIEKGEGARVREILSRLGLKLKEKYVLPALARQMYADLYNRLTYERENMRELFKELFGPHYAFEQHTAQYDTLGELGRYAAEAFGEAAQRGAAVRGRKEKRWVESAKAFIADHLKEEITLQRVADTVYLNPNYLSDLFHKETGETFIDYVTRKRIEKAKEYLRHSPARSFEVAELVGYRDSAYFSKVFKKVVGMSPSEYRNEAL